MNVMWCPCGMARTCIEMIMMELKEEVRTCRLVRSGASATMGGGWVTNQKLTRSLETSTPNWTRGERERSEISLFPQFEDCSFCLTRAQATGSDYFSDTDRLMESAR